MPTPDHTPRTSTVLFSLALLAGLTACSSESGGPDTDTAEGSAMTGETNDLTDGKQQGATGGTTSADCITLGTCDETGDPSTGGTTTGVGAAPGGGLSTGGDSAQSSDPLWSVGIPS